MSYAQDVVTYPDNDLHCHAIGYGKPNQLLKGLASGQNDVLISFSVCENRNG